MIRDLYYISICPQCGDYYQYAGFCDLCSVRLHLQCVVPRERISALAQKHEHPAVGVFVEELIQPQ